MFAVLPAENIAYATLEALLADIKNLDALLPALAQKGWLSVAGADFKASPVVQEITRQKNRQHLRQDCQSLIDSLINKLEYQPGTKHFLNADYHQAALFARLSESVVGRIDGADHNLAVLNERLGSYHGTTGNLDRALVFFEDYRQLTKQLHQADPGNANFKNSLAIAFIKMAAVFEQLKNQEQSAAHYLAAKQLLEQLVAAFPRHVKFQKNLDWLNHRLNQN